MSESLQKVKQDVENIVTEWISRDDVEANDLFVIGCSTSEVAGKQIGTSGSDEIAEVLFQSFIRLQQEKNVHLVYQCCEHLNRALVMERATLEYANLSEVTVVPAKEAGGSMATYAYYHFNDPVVVEEVQAHAGIDIGDTMIGMHLRPVAVPLRFRQKTIGSAHITIAKTRPKLIGGARAHYEKI